ncbi:MAG: archease [Spirochaetota bacterium]|nr:archease [Spirochaetota bacterium]
MCFEIVDDYSLADVAFRAYGKELSELFKNSAFAIIAIIVQNVEQISREIVKCIDLENADITLLFYEYLQEFLFYKDSSSLLLIADSVHICETTDGYKLNCITYGERIKRDKHIFNVDVKAVTMHKLLIEQRRDIWTATVVLDV